MLRIYLHVTSETMPLDAITAVMGFQPDTCYVKGAIRYKQLRAKWHGWKWEHQVLHTKDSANNDYANLAENVHAFVDRLAPYQAQLNQLAQQCDLCLQCVDDIQQGFPALHFENDVLRRMADLHLSLDVDLYEEYEPHK